MSCLLGAQCCCKGSCEIFNDASSSSLELWHSKGSLGSGVGSSDLDGWTMTGGELRIDGPGEIARTVPAGETFDQLDLFVYVTSDITKIRIWQNYKEAVNEVHRFHWSTPPTIGNFVFRTPWGDTIPIAWDATHGYYEGALVGVYRCGPSQCVGGTSCSKTYPYDRRVRVTDAGDVPGDFLIEFFYESLLGSNSLPAGPQPVFEILNGTDGVAVLTVETHFSYGELHSYADLELSTSYARMVQHYGPEPGFNASETEVTYDLGWTAPCDETLSEGWHKVTIGGGESIQADTQFSGPGEYLDGGGYPYVKIDNRSIWGTPFGYAQFMLIGEIHGLYNSRGYLGTWSLIASGDGARFRGIVARTIWGAKGCQGLEPAITCPYFSVREECTRLEFEPDTITLGNADFTGLVNSIPSGSFNPMGPGRGYYAGLADLTGLVLKKIRGCGDELGFGGTGWTYCGLLPGEDGEHPAIGGWGVNSSGGRVTVYRVRGIWSFSVLIGEPGESSVAPILDPYGGMVWINMVSCPRRDASDPGPFNVYGKDILPPTTKDYNYVRLDQKAKVWYKVYDHTEGTPPDTVDFYRSVGPYGVSPTYQAPDLDPVTITYGGDYAGSDDCDGKPYVLDGEKCCGGEAIVLGGVYSAQDTVVLLDNGQCVRVKSPRPKVDGETVVTSAVVDQYETCEKCQQCGCCQGDVKAITFKTPKWAIVYDGPTGALLCYDEQGRTITVNRTGKCVSDFAAESFTVSTNATTGGPGCENLIVANVSVFWFITGCSKINVTFLYTFGLTFMNPEAYMRIEMEGRWDEGSGDGTDCTREIDLRLKGTPFLYNVFGNIMPDYIVLNYGFPYSPGSHTFDPLDPEGIGAKAKAVYDTLCLPEEGS